MRRATIGFALAALTSLWLTPAPATAQDVARIWVTSTGIQLEPLLERAGDAESSGFVLTVSGPGGFYRRAKLGEGEAAEISVYDGKGGLVPDGFYTWELRLIPTLLESRLDRPGGLDSTTGLDRATAPARVQAGSFAVVDGAIVAGEEIEPGSDIAGTGNVLSPKTTILATDDGVVWSSLCVGFGCAGSEVFGFDTIRLKENNARLQFDDTSGSGTFPSNNWQIRANSSQNGGGNFLGFVDQGPAGSSETGTLVFSVEAGAPASALFVDDRGRTGFGTSTPAVKLHAVDGDTPSLRLEQDGSGGFTPQTWDVAGSEVGLFVRDATGGGLPLTIRPGAPTNALVVDGSGYVGLGTGSPTARLDVLGNIAVSGTVDGRDLADDGTTLDAHVADFDNPHGVSALQAGADPAGTAASAVAFHEGAFNHGNIPSALPVPIAEGGTGASDAAGARANLGIAEDRTKTGVITGESFSGNPAPTATVTFSEPFAPGTLYVVLLTAVSDDARSGFAPTVLAKDETGFTVTLGLGPSSDLVEVDWLARPVGE